VTTFNVQGAFHAEAGIPANSLSGTIDITGSAITSADLVGLSFPLYEHLLQSVFQLPMALISLRCSHRMLKPSRGRLSQSYL
jgi:hypothetical protein